MDPVHGARPVVVITEHGKGAVHRVADRAVLDVTPGGLAVVELAPGYTISDIRACTEPPVLVAPPLRA